ncbi:hypothetical protein K466DRAFT_665497 [Polyporus arcularius HHB13444]|uniref:F-box domain-containing protein n=1 Tax=Polyporus arcularius HHB13444 TaxID=1314778 RepID=A0A5C3PDH1_9APHY|nr:hypothetical protein K466DRAFT_665497 [Polyporus arcularius HHB13444]
MSNRDDDSEHDGGRSGSATAGLPWPVTLNLDILQVILWYLPRADLLSVSCTSRVVRELAIMELLSRCQKVVYGHSSPFQKWCEFVLADSRRLMCIRDLFLSFEGLNIVEAGSEEDLDDSEDSTSSETQRDIKIHEQEKIDRKPAKLVLDVLRGATCLQRLSIGWADAILDAVPGVASAISRLPALKSFTVEPYSVHAQHSVTDVLATMQSRLTFLHLLHVTYKSCDDSQTGAWDYDLPRALAPHLGTLEELHLGSPDGRTPRVRSTTLHTLEIPLAEQRPRPRELFEAFPNLRTLRTNNYWSGFDPFESVEEDRYLELRDGRISEQRGGHVWASLDTLRGSFMHLYVLGLTCPVRRLEIQSYLPSKHGAAMDIVRDASPQKLILGIKCCKSARATVHQPSLVVPESSDRPHVTTLLSGSFLVLRYRVPKISLTTSSHCYRTQRSSTSALRWAVPT